VPLAVRVDGCIEQRPFGVQPPQQERGVAFLVDPELVDKQRVSFGFQERVLQLGKAAQDPDLVRLVEQLLVRRFQVREMGQRGRGADG